MLTNEFKVFNVSSSDWLSLAELSRERGIPSDTMKDKWSPSFTEAVRRHIVLNLWKVRRFYFKEIEEFDDSVQSPHCSFKGKLY